MSWLLLAYAVGYGPLLYAAGREWIPPAVVDPLTVPAALFARVAGCEGGMQSYGRWWVVKAFRDDGRTVTVLPDGTIVSTRRPTDAERDALGQ